MAFLSNKRLKELLPHHIEPYDESNLKSGAYELSLGNEYFVTNSKEGTKTILKENEQLVIEPGQFALLITKETISIPNDILAFISIKAGVKFSGLVNVSGFHVDPGFKGKLKYSVYNAGSRNVVLNEGQKLFPIWFSELTEGLAENESYNGAHSKQDSITPLDVMRIQGELLSPNELNKKINNLGRIIGDIKYMFSIILSILVPIFVGIILSLYTNEENKNLKKEMTIEEKTDSLAKKTNNISVDSLSKKK